MLGLIIALFCVAIWYGLQNVALATAVASALHFLLLWNIWTISIIAGILAVIGIVCIIYGFGCKSVKEGAAAWTFACLVPFLYIKLVILAGLYIGGTLIMQAAITGGAEADWNMNKLWLGGIMYAVGLIFQLTSSASIKKS